MFANHFITLLPSFIEKVHHLQRTIFESSYFNPQVQKDIFDGQRCSFRIGWNFAMIRIFIQRPVYQISRP